MSLSLSIEYLMLMPSAVGMMGLGPELLPEWFDHNFYMVIAVGFFFSAATVYTSYLPVAVICILLGCLYVVMFTLKTIEKRGEKHEAQ